MKRIVVAPSSISGQGVFADEDIAAGEPIRRVIGPIMSYINRTKEDALANPDWIGIGRDRWIDPQGPLKFLNHSCDANAGAVTAPDDAVFVVAVRDIGKGEELTLDYSTTEIDPAWEMACTCGSVHCRHVVRSIVTLPRERYERYLPYVPAHFQDVYAAATE